MSDRNFALILILILLFVSLLGATSGKTPNPTRLNPIRTHSIHGEITRMVYHGAWTPPAWCTVYGIDAGGGNLQQKVYTLLNWYQSIGIDTLFFCFTRPDVGHTTTFDPNYLTLCDKIVDEAYARGMRTVFYEWLVDDDPWDALIIGTLAAVNIHFANWCTFYNNLALHYKGNNKVIGFIPCSNTDRFTRPGNPWGFTDADVYDGDASPIWMAYMDDMEDAIHSADNTKTFFCPPMPNFGDHWVGYTTPLNSVGPVTYHVMLGYATNDLGASYYPLTSSFDNVLNWRDSHNTEVVTEFILAGEEMGWSSGWTWNTEAETWLNNWLIEMENNNFSWYWESLYDPSNSLDRRSNNGGLPNEFPWVQYLRDYL